MSCLNYQLALDSLSPISLCTAFLAARTLKLIAVVSSSVTSHHVTLYPCERSRQNYLDCQTNFSDLQGVPEM